MLKHMVLALFVAIGLLGFANPVLAVDNQGTVADCSSATADTIEQCLMGDTISSTSSSPWWCFWCPKDQPKDQDCSLIKVIDYTTCIAKCTCQYNNNVKKCDGQTCRDAQELDYRTCLKQCEIDWVSVPV
jgi:hypothetical protein